MVFPLVLPIVLCTTVSSLSPQFAIYLMGLLLLQASGFLTQGIPGYSGKSLQGRLKVRQKKEWANLKASHAYPSESLNLGKQVIPVWVLLQRLKVPLFAYRMPNIGFVLALDLY